MKNVISILPQYSGAITEAQLDQLLPDFWTGINKDILLWDAGIGRTHGYGQYKMTVTLCFGGEEHTFTKHTTDSQLFDSDDVDYQLNEVIEQTLSYHEDTLEELLETMTEEHEQELAEQEGD